MKSIGIIGFGNMGEALGSGLSMKYGDLKWTVLEKFAPAAEKALSLGAQVVDNLQKLAGQSEVLIVAIKPQDIPEMLKNLAPWIKPEHTIISIAAGLKTTFFQEKLGTHQVVRYMPNLAAKAGKSLVGVAFGQGLDPQRGELALEIASSLGQGSLVPEKLMSAVTGISGSGLAFVFEFIHALALGGVREGLPYPQALDFSLATVEGAAALLRQSGEHPSAMTSKVISPAGTTIEGVRALKEYGMEIAVMEAVSAAARRATELEG